MPCDSGIYEIRNLADGKRYIGSAVHLRRRWDLHRCRLGKGKHHSRYLQNAWSKYGEAAFRFQTMLICSPADLLMYEQRCLDALKPEYNISPTAGSALGAKRSPEMRAKMSILKKGHQPFLGKSHSEETKAKISAANKGRAFSKGTKRSAEVIEKTASKNRGRKASPETRARMSAARLGVKLGPRRKEGARDA